MKKGIKYSFLTLAWLVGAIVFLLLLASLLIQTQPVKNKLARFSEKQAEKVLNGELTIGEIDGNFFTGLILENVLLKYENDTLAYFDKFTVNYNLWSLVDGDVNISSAEIENPYFYLEQYEDSTWNVQKIVKIEPGEKDTTARPGKFEINLSDVSIVEGTIKTSTPDTIIPERVENWNTQFSLYLGGNKQIAKVNEFSFSTVAPDFSLKELTFELNRDSNYIQLTDFFIKTAQNQLDGNAEYNPEPSREGMANFETSELQLNEFEYFIPSLKLPAKPVIKIDAEMKGDSAFVNLDLKENDQHIVISASSPNLAEFLFNTEKPELLYTLDGTLQNIELAHWIGNPELNYFINGQLSASGHGIDPKNASIKVNGDFNETVIEDKRLTELLVDLQLNQGNLDGTVQGSSEFGSFKVTSKIKKLFDLPVYDARVTTSGLNLAMLTGNDSLSSNLNIIANIKGRDFDPKKLSVSGNLFMNDSRFRKVQIDTLFTEAGYRNDNLKIDSLWLKSKAVTMQASGNYSSNSASDLELTARFRNIDEFRNYIPVDSFYTSGNLKAHLQGTPDSLGLTASLKLDETNYKNIAAELFELNGTASLTPNDTTFNFEGSVDNLYSEENKIDSVYFKIEGTLDSLLANATIFNSEVHISSNTIIVEEFNIRGDAKFAQPDTTFNISGMASKVTAAENNLDTISFNVSGTPDSMFMAAKITGDEINTQFKSNFMPGDTMKITLSEWLINYRNQNWALQDPPAIIELDSSNYIVDNFKLVSGSDDSIQHILVQGKITNNGRENFKLELGNINVAKLSDILDLESKPAGFLDLNINVKGTSESPEITGNYKLNKASFNDYRFTKFNGGINYINNQLNVKTLIVPQDSGKFDVNATLPISINLDTMGYTLNPKDSIDGDIVFEKFSLNILQALKLPGDFSGSLQGKIALGGTVESPNPNGNLNLNNASVEDDQYGIDYRDIRLKISFNDNKLILDTLSILTDDGSLKGTGQVDFESEFYKGNVSQSQIDLMFDQFNLVNHKQFNMQLSGHASLGGEKGNVVYGGDLKIPQAEIYLPAILGMVGKMNVPEIPKPILVREVERMDISIDSIDVQTFSPLTPESGMQFNYLNDLQGQLRIRIPKNTWIKNEDMRVEISGELELRKKNEYFELFGTVDVVRGQYDLLGKTFNITEGSVSFQGGEDITPRLNINATYTFRNAQKAQQNLSVNITGTPESPEVNFMLDGSSISEGDALSYILFGKSMNELTLSEQENVSGSGNIAGRAAASVLSSQLSSFLGNKLNVDYIEVKSQGSFDNASVVVGKYITNDLFVSYEQRFGEVDQKDVAKYEVKLEYELFRFLFFELNNSSTESGFDVIVKFDVK